MAPSAFSIVLSSLSLRRDILDEKDYEVHPLMIESILVEAECEGGGRSRVYVAMDLVAKAVKKR